MASEQAHVDQLVGPLIRILGTFYKLQTIP